MTRFPIPDSRFPLFEHLYVHIPFCARRCTYCDFSIAVRKETPVREFLGGIAAELKHTGPPAGLSTLYLGGGTPSRLGGEGIGRLAGMLGAGAGISEFTVEANPEDVTPEAVRAWRDAGVNRMSLGGQSFDDNVLAWMHRTHRADAIGRAIHIAREGGIANVSLDLIFWLPETLKRDWRADLERAVALAPDHISLYGLTVETGTPLARQVLRGQAATAPDARYADEYLLAHELLGAAGYRFYEVSNASLPGLEAVHNRAYWRRVPYLGLGPSAHSFDGTTRWWNEPAYARWLALLSSEQSPIVEREVLNAAEQRMEEQYLGLRTVEGLTTRQPDAAQLLQRVSGWVRAGWAVVDQPSHAPDESRIRLTPLGWLRLDELVASV